MMDGLLAVLPSWAMAGAGAGGGYFVVLKFFEWIGGRVDKREDRVEAGAIRLDAAMQQLIKNLEDRMTGLTARLDTVEHELTECRAQHAKCEAELHRLKGLIQGLGEAKQTAAVIIAADRVADRKDVQ